jgi:hypothetical protein
VERVENQTQVFPLFPPLLGNLANPARFPHSHSSGGPRLEKWKTKIRFPTFPHATRDDDDGSFQKVKIKVKPGRLRRPKEQPKEGEHRAADCHFPLLFPGSPRIGIKPCFQAHSALESNNVFRLTFGLENAAQLVREIFGRAGVVAAPVIKPGSRAAN